MAKTNKRKELLELVQYFKPGCKMPKTVEDKIKFLMELNPKIKGKVEYGEISKVKNGRTVKKDRIRLDFYPFGLAHRKFYRDGGDMLRDVLEPMKESKRLKKLHGGDLGLVN